MTQDEICELIGGIANGHVWSGKEKKLFKKLCAEKENVSYPVKRKLLASLALLFIDDTGCNRSVNYLDHDELDGDDVAKLPKGKGIKITIEYFNLSDTDFKSASSCDVEKGDGS